MCASSFLRRACDTALVSDSLGFLAEKNLPKTYTVLYPQRPPHRWQAQVQVFPRCMPLTRVRIDQSPSV